MDQRRHVTAAPAGRIGTVNFRIRHETEYRFSAPAFLEPHTVRLSPRSDGATIVGNSSILVDPAPATHSRHLDAEGNVVDQLHFSGLHPRLLITTESNVTTTRGNPFDFVPLERATSLPIAYTAAERSVLAPYLQVSQHPKVDAFARSWVDSSPRPALVSQLLSDLNEKLSSGHRTVVRPEGDPFSPDVSLETRDLSCRDFAVLFVAVCRALGIAARFVSGYQAGDPEQDIRDLHAWSEVYLPGGGWRGYDPTLGLAVADEHVAVAAAAHPADAAPVSGSYRGTGVVAEILTHISLDCD